MWQPYSWQPGGPGREPTPCLRSSLEALMAGTTRSGSHPWREGADPGAPGLVRKGQAQVTTPAYRCVYCSVQCSRECCDVMGWGWETKRDGMTMDEGVGVGVDVGVGADQKSSSGL